VPIVIERVELAGGIVVYQSPLLRAAGVPHAFSTRIGGVSTGPFASMNLGNPGGQAQQDHHENIAENYRRLQRAMGCEHRKRYFAHQVHGATVLAPGACPATDSIHGGIEIGHGDALVTDDASALLSVRVADCVPVLLATRDGGRVAAVHAGWRGVVQGAALAALSQLLSDSRSRSTTRDGQTNATGEVQKRGQTPIFRDIFAAIGPSIGMDAFEVGAEVLEAFRGVFGAETPCRSSPTDPRKAHIDLREALRTQLIQAGVPAEQIDATDRCTVRDADEFFSHRRENGLTGRMAAIIGVRA
jgi:polyphenol oxidase